MTKRIRTSMGAEFIAGRVRGKGMVRNVGMEGLFVGTSSLPQQGESVKLRFRAPGGRAVQISGLVWWTSADPAARRCSEPGFGLRLLGDNEAYESLIRELYDH